VTRGVGSLSAVRTGRRNGEGANGKGCWALNTTENAVQSRFFSNESLAKVSSLSRLAVSLPMPTDENDPDHQINLSGQAQLANPNGRLISRKLSSRSLADI
jgi:hypothetical protein